MNGQINKKVGLEKEIKKMKKFTDKINESCLI